MLEKLLNESLLTNLFRVVSFLKSLKLTSCLGKSSFAGLLLEDEDNEGALLVTLRLLTAPMEKHGHLVYF